MNLAVAVFAVSFLFTAWVYFGYPLLIFVVARLRERKVAVDESHRPKVTVVVPVHNEEEVIADKVVNTLSLEYPAPLLETIIVSDGSTDATAEIVRTTGRGRVRLLEQPRRGKALALNAAAEAATGEVLVLTDANAMLQSDSIVKIVRNFADAEVGGVCGNKKYRVTSGGDTTEQGENLYWRWDKWQKSMESRIGSVFAADGTLYAVRRHLYVPIDDPAQADDIAVSARVVLQGARLIWEPEAIAWEEAPREGADEFRRKVRVTNHSVRALLKLGPALFTRGFYSVELLSHKLLRHLVPFALAALFVSNAVAAFGSRRFAFLLAAQLLFYALGTAGAFLRGRPLGSFKLFAVPYYFCLVNAAALLGVVSILSGERLAAWSPRGGMQQGGKK